MSKLYILIILSIFLLGCSHNTIQRVEKGTAGPAYVKDQSICHDVSMKGQKSDLVICSSEYPLIYEGNEVEIVYLRDGNKRFILPNYKNFEVFFSSLPDKRAISNLAFQYFDSKGQIDHTRYAQEWKKKCKQNGLYCRLLAYIEKAENADKTNSRFFDLMEKGCNDLDIHSCFNLLMRKKDLKKEDKKKIQMKIKPICEKAIKNYDYHDFCNELLHGI